MGVVRAENSDYSKNNGKNTEIHTPLVQGLVLMVILMELTRLKTYPAQGEATKARPKIRNNSSLYI